MGNTQALESSGKYTSSISMKDDSPMPLRDELEERFAQLVVMLLNCFRLYCIIDTGQAAS